MIDRLANEMPASERQDNIKQLGNAHSANIVVLVDGTGSSIRTYSWLSTKVTASPGLALTSVLFMIFLRSYFGPCLLAW